MRLTRLLLVGALLVAGPLQAEEDPPKMPVLNEADTAAALAHAESVGRLMFLHDLAAERATDALVARYRGFSKEKRMRGWITEQRGDTVVVSFVDDTPAVRYRATVDQSGAIVGAPEKLTEPAPLTAYEAGAEKARTAAMHTQVQACAPTYNTVVLPAADDHRHWTVYLLPATSRPDVVPLGGSHRMEVVDDTIIGRRDYTYTCIQLQRGRGIEAIMTTHLLDPVPTEVHVFWNLWARTPMFLGTSNGLMWELREGSVRPLEEDAPTSSSSL